MTNERKDTPDGPDPADDAALWRLLGRARTPQVGPYFSRRVLREVTLFEEGKRPTPTVRGWGWLAAWRRSRASAWWPGAVCAAVFWLSVVLTTNAPRPGASSVPAGRPVVADADEVAPQDVEVIADLDNMIAREESRIWTDDTARF